MIRKSITAGLYPLVTLAIAALAVPAQADLVRAGPVSPDNGYPLFYEDENNLRLSLCLDFQSGFCLLDGPINLSNANGSFPGNYGGTWPDETFWWSGETTVQTIGGGTGLLVMALEGAFFNEAIVDGDQIAFGRIRLRLDNLRAGAEYTITTPFGVFTEVAETPSGRRNINMTEDIGLVEKDFTAVLSAKVGPFLVWDSDRPIIDPATGDEYVGDPAIAHTVTGSSFLVGHGYGNNAGPDNANFFRIEGPQVADNNSPDRCRDRALGPNPNGRNDCVETNLFNIQGRLATDFGVEPVRTTYTRSGNGRGRVDILASSVDGQAVEAEFSGRTVTMVEDTDGNGQYFSRRSFNTGGVPLPEDRLITLRNLSDDPVVPVTSVLVDTLTVTKADYDTDTGVLKLKVNSSDNIDESLGQRPTLRAYNTFGHLLTCEGSTTLPDNASVDCPVFPIAEVIVKSSAGGIARQTVRIIGSNVSD